MTDPKPNKESPIGTESTSGSQAETVHRCETCSRLFSLDGTTPTPEPPIQPVKLPEEVEEALKDARKHVGPGPKYVLVRPIGRGGMGEVHLAWDLELARWVAMKFILNAHGQTAIDRFRREARLAAALIHPNIACVFDFGPHGGDFYFAMQYIPGKTLADAGIVDVRRICRMIRDAALAVHYAHGKGIVHRDLKPGNLMIAEVDGEERVFVMDFGLAKSVEGAGTGTGTVQGTLPFMAPEQAGGRGDVGAPTDIYALGATLYALVAGRMPHQGASAAEILEKIARGVPAEPASGVNRAVPPELDRIIDKAMRLEPRERYGSMKDFADALTEWLDGVAAAGKRSRKRLLLAIAAAVAVGAAVLAWALTRPKHAGEISVTIGDGGGFVGTAAVTARLSAQHAVAVRLRERGGQWTGWTAWRPDFAFALSPGDGPKVVEVEFRGENGKVAAVEAGVTLDTTPPKGALKAPAVTRESRVVIECEAADGGSGVEGVRFAGGGWEQFAPKKDVELKEGQNEIRVDVRDRVGNVARLSKTVVLDTVPPSGSLSAPRFVGAAGFTVANNVTGAATMRFDGDESSVPFDRARFLKPSGTDGPKTIEARFWDEAGNEFRTAVEIVLDTTPPVGSIEAVKLTKDRTITVANRVSGAVRMQFPGDAEPAAFAPVRAVMLDGADGPKMIDARFWDEAGNELRAEAEVVLKTTPPAGIIRLDASVTRDRSVVVTNQITGAVRMQYPDDREPVDFSPTRFFALDGGDGPKTIEVRFWDEAGNELRASALVVLDTAPPTGTIRVASKVTKDRTVTVANWVSGASRMRFSGDDEPVSFAPVRAVMLEGADGPKKIEAFFWDEAGNALHVATEIVLKTEPPTPKIEVRSEGDRKILLIEAGGASEMAFRSEEVGWSRREKVAKSRELQPDEKIVAVRFWDDAGNYADVPVRSQEEERRGPLTPPPRLGAEGDVVPFANALFGVWSNSLKFEAMTVKGERTTESGISPVVRTEFGLRAWRSWSGRLYAEVAEGDQTALTTFGLMFGRDVFHDRVLFADVAVDVQVGGFVSDFNVAWKEFGDFGIGMGWRVGVGARVELGSGWMLDARFDWRDASLPWQGPDVISGDRQVAEKGPTFAFGIAYEF